MTFPLAIAALFLFALLSFYTPSSAFRSVGRPLAIVPTIAKYGFQSHHKLYAEKTKAEIEREEGEFFESEVYFYHRKYVIQVTNGPFFLSFLVR